jgi:hypothetical protein
MRVVPRACLPHQNDVGRRTGLQGGHVSLQECVLVPDHNLWQQRLQVGAVANEGDMSETGALPILRDMLHRLVLPLPLLAEEDRAQPIAAEQGHRGLVYVEAQGRFPRRDLARIKVPPLPHRECL